MEKLLKRQKIVIPLILLLLSIPLVAQGFTDEVDWQLPDFIIMGVLLFIFINLIWFLIDKVSHGKVHWLLVLATIILFLLVWAELGVGIFGTPWAGD